MDMNTLVKHIPLKVFLCHSHADRSTVHNLYLRLKKSHVQPWLDKENLLGGHNWAHEIHTAILRSDVVIVCLSAEFDKEKGFRHQELKIALRKARVLPKKDIFIIPVRFEKCSMPDSIRHLHRVDLFEADGYQKLIQSLRQRMQMK